MIRDAQWCDLHHSFHRDCRACVDADYARLEGEKAAMAAALRLAWQAIPALRSFVAIKAAGDPARLKALQLADRAMKLADAALSGEGKGWEQALAFVEGFADEGHSATTSRHPHDSETCDTCAANELLAAMKGEA